jgi:hypothetical protein
MLLRKLDVSLLKLPELLNLDQTAEFQINAGFAVKDSLDSEVFAAVDFGKVTGLLIAEPAADLSVVFAIGLLQPNRALLGVVMWQQRSSLGKTANGDFFAVVLLAREIGRLPIFTKQGTDR